MTDLKKLAEDIVASYDARIKVVKDIVGDTQRMLQNFRARREEMSSDLRDGLAKNENLRKKDFDSMMQDILAVQEERESNVRQMLSDFEKEEGLVAGGLRKLLQRGEKIRIKDFKKILAKIRNEQEKREKETSKKVSSELKEMQEEVGGMLSGFKKEREKVASEWKNMVSELSQFKKGKNNF